MRKLNFLASRIELEGKKLYQLFTMNKNILHTPNHPEDVQPLIFKTTDKAYKKFCENLPVSMMVVDEIEAQLKGLIKSRNPSKKFTDEDWQTILPEFLGATLLDDYGVWVYYPWLNKLVHLLDEEEFIELRTNRNKYKLTQEEQAILRTKKVGVIGLSVGHAIATSMAMERVCGAMHLADFDELELSNLNRIRTGVQNLGLKKTTIAAREIAEIDPFIKVTIYSDGIQDYNMESFFTNESAIDLLVEVCDGIEQKIASRLMAKELKIPVVMDTNDRGMIDIERFDLEPQRPLLHGLAAGLTPETLANQTMEERINTVMRIVDFENTSDKLKYSMNEIGKTISSWPQLASSVLLGGAVTTDVVRRVFLNELKSSGRFYVDLDQLIQ